LSRNGGHAPPRGFGRRVVASAWKVNPRSSERQNAFSGLYRGVFQHSLREGLDRSVLPPQPGDSEHNRVQPGRQCLRGVGQQTQPVHEPYPMASRNRVAPAPEHHHHLRLGPRGKAPHSGGQEVTAAAANGDEAPHLAGRSHMKRGASLWNETRSRSESPRVRSPWCRRAARSRPAIVPRLVSSSPEARGSSSHTERAQRFEEVVPTRNIPALPAWADGRNAEGSIPAQKTRSPSAVISTRRYLAVSLCGIADRPSTEWVRSQSTIRERVLRPVRAGPTTIGRPPIPVGFALRNNGRCVSSRKSYPVFVRIVQRPHAERAPPPAFCWERGSSPVCASRSWHHPRRLGRLPPHSVIFSPNNKKTKRKR